jgi:hypothetical protein
MFAVHRMESWKDAVQMADLLGEWLFRGHSSESWGLETTLFRGATASKYPLDCLGHAEDWMLREFQRQAHLHDLKTLPVDKLEWLALIQHYGGPTRLLDFSYSFYVAAFFAMERASGDAAVWAIDRMQLARMIAKKTGADIDNENIERTNRRHIEHAFNTNQPQPIVVNIEPGRMNERLAMQKGLFLLPCDPGVSFASSLEQTFDLSDGTLKPDPPGEGTVIADQFSLGSSIVKMILPLAIHDTALRDLHKMNVNSTTLFPGLDGFARSLSFYLRTNPGGVPPNGSTK